MNLNDLLQRRQINPQNVLVLRHRPHEPGLMKVLPFLAAEKPDDFNAYQSTQSPNLEKAMQAMVGSGFVVSFIGIEPGKALFVGLYSIDGSSPLTHREYWEISAHKRMKEFGMEGWVRERDDRGAILRFDLKRRDFYESWQGKLIVGWPPPERSWWRRAHKNEIPVLAILEESALRSELPQWDEVDFTWEQLRILPPSLKAALAQWRGIYYIFDTANRKGYVGSAYGDKNLFGRWMTYAARGHGGNSLLRKCDPRNFRFTILERLSPDADVAQVVELENSWKQRLHTRSPNGLNDN